MDSSPELAEVVQILKDRGVHAGLRFLNSRTPHRFTGVYRYDGETLRNVALFDRFTPELEHGDDVAMKDAYCSIVGQTREALEFADARNDKRFEFKPGSPVVCYCGVLLRDEQGEPFGTLCHFDVQRCDHPASELPLLQAAAPHVYASLRLQPTAFASGSA